MPKVQDPLLEQTKAEARFWAKVNKTEDCWLWTGARFNTGYARFSSGKKSFGAHRWLYEYLNCALSLPLPG